MLRETLLLASISLAAFSLARKEFKRDTAAVLTQRYGNFKDECFPRPSGGCNCNVKDSSGVQRVKSFNTDAECKVPIEDLLETALKKQEVNEQIKQKFGNLKENCFPKPSGGCKCNEMDSNGNEVVRSYDSEADCNLPLPMSIAVDTVLKKHKMTEEIKQKFGDFKENCFPKPSGGCRCNEKDQHGNDIVGIYDSDAECKVLLPSAVEVETAQKKHEVNEAIKHKFGDFKESCFPRPSGGCRCNEKDANGNEVVVSYESEIECRADMTSSIEVRTAQNKKKVNEQIKQKYGAFKENCFPKPSGGCSCNEKDARGKDIVAKYNTDAECKIPMRSKRGGVQRPSQNVRDPVRERAQANYAAVVNELNEKFKGLKEGCFPRPKGCLCVIGKDKDGRDITERRMKDRDCKCQPGERGKGCPVGGA